MSFSITLQTNLSEKNRLDKTITDITTVTGTLKDRTSILNPTILIEGDISSVIACNYMTIPTFGRSYFVNDIVSVHNNLYEISAHVDVLTTYKTGIRANTGITKRQASNYNLYLDDGSLKIYNNPKIVTKVFPSGFGTAEFVLAVAGG